MLVDNSLDYGEKFEHMLRFDGLEMQESMRFNVNIGVVIERICFIFMQL